MTIAMQGFARIVPGCRDQAQPDSGPTTYVREDFRATTTGDVYDGNLMVDELGNGWNGPALWDYEGDGSGVQYVGTSGNSAILIETDGREDVRVVAEMVIARGDTATRWQAVCLRSTSGSYEDGIRAWIQGTTIAPTIIVRKGAGTGTTVDNWPLPSLMVSPPVDGDTVRMVIYCIGDDIILHSISVNGATPEVFNPDDTRITLTGADATAYGANSGADWYGLYSNEQYASSVERFRYFEVTGIPPDSPVLDPVIELNPWNVWLAQSFLECNPGEEDCPTPIPQFRSSQIMGCLGCEFRPVIPKCLPSQPVHDNQGGGFFGWWFDPSLPEVSGEAYGFVFHDFTLTDPRALSASRSEALRQRLTIHDGLLLGEMIVEVLAADVRSSKWLAARVKDELESMALCCPASMDVYADCVTKDGISGLRRLRSVGEFHVTELAEMAPMAPTSTMLSIVFAAATLVDVPDGLASGTATLLGEADLGPCETPVTSTLGYLPKTVLNIDLELIDGALRVCPVDVELGLYSAASHYMVVRELRADPPVPCPIEVALDLTAATPVITAYQPTLWAEQLARIGTGEGIDCQNNPIVVRSARINNPDYNPDCLTCPPGIRAAGCAVDAGLVYDAAGIINWPGSGITASTWYEVGTGGTPSAAMQKILDYWQCLKVRGESFNGSGMIPNQELWNFNAVIASWAGPGTATHYRVRIDQLGTPQVQIESSAGGGPINVDAIVAVDGNSFPGYSATDIIYTDELIEDCIEGPPECFPIIEGVPSGTGPCVTITVNAAGVASMPLNPTVDDLSTARFEFAPCADTDCPGVIPVEAPVTVAGDVATPVGWSPGWLWPSDSEGSQYEVLTVGGAANSVDPVEILVFTGGLQPTSPREVWRSHLTGLSPTLHYRPGWSIVADRAATDVRVALWVGGPGDTPPDETTMQAGLLCGGGAESVLLIAGPVAAGDRVEFGSDGLTFTPAGGVPVDAFGAGIVSAAEAWQAPEVFGATQVALFVSWPPPGSWTYTSPAIGFEVVPEVTP